MAVVVAGEELNVAGLPEPKIEEVVVAPNIDPDPVEDADAPKGGLFEPNAGMGATPVP
jgi:hypothetical protein